MKIGISKSISKTTEQEGGILVALILFIDQVVKKRISVLKLPVFRGVTVWSDIQ